MNDCLDQTDLWVCLLEIPWIALTGDGRPLGGIISWAENPDCRMHEFVNSLLSALTATSCDQFVYGSAMMTFLTQ